MPRKQIDLVCEVCAKPFVWDRRKTYCSDECKREKTRLKAEVWRESQEPDKVREIARRSKRKARTKDGGRERERATQLRYYENNKEAIGRRTRARYAADPDKILAQNARWREENPEKLKDSHARHYVKTAKKRRAYSREWYANNTAKAAATQKRWREENPEIVRAARRRYEARKRGAADYESIVPLVVFERDCWRCGICGKKVDKRLKWPHRRAASLDHIVPLIKGGSHLYENVQLAHLSCNSSKKHLGSGDQLLLFG